jgi:hypothetical protein
LKKNKNIAFPNTFDFGQDHDDWLISSHII